MSFNDNIPKLKPYTRSVSIIGVGGNAFCPSAGRSCRERYE